MNLIHIIGHLGADPEHRVTPSGQKLWKLRVATRTRKNGQDDTIWWNLTIWGDQYDKMLVHFKKGKPAYVVAEMNKLDIYTDKNGQPQISYEATVRSLHFVPLGEKQDNEQGSNASQGTSQGGYQGGMSSGYTNQPAAPTAYRAAAPQQQPAQAYHGMGEADHGQHEEEPIPF